MALTPSLRQVLVVISLQLAAMTMGGAVGYPCVLMQQFQLETSDIRPDLDTSTWIVSTYGIAGTLSIFMPTIMQSRGRKFAFILSCLIITIGWSLFYIARGTAMLIVAQFFLGFGSNSIIIVNLMTTSEMVAPKYRSVSMMLLGVNQSLGMAGVSVLGNFLNWRAISLVMSSPAIIALLIVFIWTESPPWLAHIGKFDECKKSFALLRGESDEAMKEYHALIAAQKGTERKLPNTQLKQILAKCSRKDFYLPSLLTLIVLCNFFLAGAFSLFIYTQQVLEIGTGNIKAAMYGLLYRDISLVVGACGGLVLVKYFKSKSILLYTTAACVLSLCICFVVTFLKSVGALSQDSLLLVYTFSLYMTFCNCGYNNISFTLPGELMPVKHRGIGGSLFIIFSCSLTSISAKTYPYLIIYLNLWGTFLLFAVLGTVTGILIWLYVPNTNNRTLQEVEDYYNNSSYIKNNVDDTHLSLNICKD